MMQGGMMPSPATISRYRLFLDHAHMQHMRALHRTMVEAGGVCYGLMDSSPQGRRDYLMQRYLYISWEHLEICGELVDELFR